MTTPMNTPLNVPIRVDAAWSDGATLVSPPSVDFTRLWNTIPAAGASFGNAEPWLGDTIASDLSLAPLPLGLHLHWTLPRGLRHGATVYALDEAVYNELVQQGMPCPLVQALKDKATAGAEMTLDGLNALLGGLVGNAATPLTAASFAPMTSAKTYGALISPQSGVDAYSISATIGWDPILLEIYGPMVAHAAARMKLPPVPNRWLVTRDDASGASAAWVIESDRLTPPNADGSAPPGAGPTAVPATFTETSWAGGAAVTAPMTFQFLGFVTPAASWSESTSRTTLAPLTATGHGLPDFAAFYPNCQGVFGFHDATADKDTAYGYSVIGWFSDPADDPASPTYAVGPWSAETIARRLAELGWAPPDGSDLSTVDGSVYTGGISATGAACALAAATQCDSSVMVAVGDTAGAALASTLAAAAATATGSGQSPGLGLTPETILNAAQVGLLGAAAEADGPATIANALHQQAFQSASHGWLWEVIPPAPASDGLSANGPPKPAPVSAGVARALNALNDAQMRFDRVRDWLTSQRRLLFTDWCRALHLATDASGTDSDVSPNAETPGSAPGVEIGMLATMVVNQMATAVDEVGMGQENARNMLPYQAGAALYHAHAVALAALAEDAAAADGKVKGKVGGKAQAGGAGSRLARRPAPPFWRPNDPVVLMSDPSGASLTAKPANDPPRTVVQGTSRLICAVIAAQSGASPTALPAALPTGWSAAAGAGPSADCVAAILAGSTATRGGPSWRPLLLHWQASFTPFKDAGTISATNATPPAFAVTAYPTGFISDRFQPGPDGVDLVATSTATAPDGEAVTYEGRVPLSGHATRTMRDRLIRLAGLDEAAPPTTIAADDWPAALGSCGALLSSAYAADEPTLSQSLDGFHDRLLMLRRLSQISAFHPDTGASWLGDQYGDAVWDAHSQSFYNEIGVQGVASPCQDDQFNPIRAGRCALTGLSLVDAFGQVRRWALSTDNLLIAESLPNLTAATQSAAPAFLLPPRLAQPARLLFRWMTADGGHEVESPQGVAATPICGWIALNHVDATILVFQRDGTLVGGISTATGEVVAGPGVGLVAITDPFLTQVVTQIQGDAGQWFDDVADALLTIEPHAHRQLSARATLVSRPLALARVSLRMELLGTPAPHQGYEWLATATLDDYDDPVTETWCPLPANDAIGAAITPASPFARRETCGWTAVGWPIRLGDVSVDDDGLVAYWPIDGTGTVAPAYQLPGSGPAGDGAAKKSAGGTGGETGEKVGGGTGAEPTLSLTCDPAAPAIQVLTLLDPRAPVHATSGILPTGAISIPAEIYAPALRAMEYVMAVGPILTPPDQIRLPLPTETPTPWTWVDETPDGATAIPQGAAPSKSGPGFSGKSDDRAHQTHQPPVFRQGRLQTNIT